MYITKNLVTSTRMIPGQSYELNPELEQKFRQYRAFSKLVFDAEGNLVDIVEDSDKKAAGRRKRRRTGPTADGKSERGAKAARQILESV